MAVKWPHYLTLKDGSPLSFAALWERWDPGGAPIQTFTIITTAACPGLADIHRRQPAIIDPRWFTQWLDPRTPLPALLELAREPHDGPFDRRAVSTRVNSVHNDDPDVLTAAPDSGLF
ncbi:MAG: SOS response-associated peptidase family protein [Gemmatimonadota bacterium]|nr:SOS response-associated peptidase family protein [Gemmatimonadota bacterium]